MRIALVTHFFPPEVGAPQARLSELAGLWAEAGHEVTVLTGLPNHPTGSVPAEYRGSLVRTSKMDGYAVIRTWLYATPNVGVLKRTLNHLSFMISSATLGPASFGGVDIVVVSSPTYFSMFSGWWVSRIKRAKLVVEIRDLWPALIVELGVVKHNVAIRMLEAAELWMYGQADAIVVVTDGFKRVLTARGVPASKIMTITNGVDMDRFSSTTDRGLVRSEYLNGDDDVLLVLYLGAHGISQGLSSVVEAAGLLQDEPIQFVFVGEGADKPKVVAAADELGLGNVTFHPSISSDEVGSLISAADVFLVPLRDEPIFDVFIPSKLFEALAVGTPIVGSLRGEAADILESVGATVVPPESPTALAEALREFAASPPKQPEYSQRSKAMVKARFDRRALASRYTDLLESTVSGTRGEGQ